MKKGPIRWMAINHVSSNLLMMVFIFGGLLMAFNMKQEVFPEIPMDMVSISVAYPGAGPEEVEEGIVLNIEEGISGVTGIKEVKGSASEGFANVTAEVLPGYDIDLVVADIKSEVDRITTFPEEAEKPVVTKLVNRMEVISIIVYGEMPERSLREYAELINDELLAMPLITQTSFGGVRPYEISIEVTEENLRRYNLTLDAIAARIRQASVDLPAGTIKAEGGEVLIRTKEKRYRGPEFSSIVILERPDGSEVTLGEIATVRDTFAEADVFALLDNMPGAIVSVYRVGDQKPTKISKAVKEYVEAKRAVLPPTVKLATLNDASELLKGRMNLLLKNAFLGLILVFLVLGLFLQVRLALWVMLGIPISFLGAMFMMPALDVSINMLSLFAFILALGIVVDDAIVVGENIFEHRDRGKNYMAAAIDGATEVAGPVVFSVLTTVTAFLPLLFIAGMMGKFIKTIPLVVIPILALSLIESLFILPSHLGHGKKRDHGTRGPGLVERIRLRFARGLGRFVAGPYTRALRFAVKNRYATLATAIAILLISVGVVAGGVVKFRFMPKVDGDFIISALEMPIGTPVSETARAQEVLVRRAQEVAAEYDAKRKDKLSILDHIYSSVGTGIDRGGFGEKPLGGGHYAEVALILTPSEKREVPATEIANRWRDLVGDLPGTESLTFTSDLVHFGANVDVRLAHQDFGVLTAASERVKKVLASYPGVGDITDTYSEGKSELKLTLKPEARTLGITEAELGRQVRAAFYGAEALRFQRGRNELKVMVRYPEADRKSVADLEAMRIRTPSGMEVPFTDAAYVEEGRGYSEIMRADRKRVISITASVDNTVANAEEILADLKAGVLADVTADYRGLTYDLVGEAKERRESMGTMVTGFGLALFAMYALLSIPFKSYSQPMMIMTAIPFGFVGALIGHGIMGFNLSILSMFGLVALAGVLVNDSLLLIDFINKRRLAGAEPLVAVTEAGQRRFRPIVLTSLTTFLGLAPMISETSVQAQFLIPMAISLGFGILFATGITLILIPSLYMIQHDLREMFGMKPVHLRHANTHAAEDTAGEGDGEGQPDAEGKEEGAT